MNILINAGLILLSLAALAFPVVVIMANRIRRLREEQFRFEQEHS